MNTDCIFCMIIAGEIPTQFLYQDEEMVAFADIRPLAPVHILVVPREHIASLEHMAAADAPLLGRMTMVARKLAAEKGIAKRGYRLVVNTGPDGGQVVPHLHLHLMGGRQL